MGGAGAESGPASRVRAVLFDLDGTLIDTIELILSSFRFSTASVLGEALPDDVLLRDVGTPLVKQMASISPEHAEELVRVYRAHNAIHHDTMAAEYPGTAAALRAIRDAGYPVGVVTSKFAVGARRGIRLFNLERHIDVIVGADDVEIHKPDPYPLRRGAELLGMELAECAYVGDSPHDMAAAVAGGAVSVAALWGPFPRQDVLAHGPDYALESITELPGILGIESAIRPAGYAKGEDSSSRNG